MTQELLDEMDEIIEEKLNLEVFEDKITALEESEMQMFRFLKDRPAGAILTADTDIMLTKLLQASGLADFDEETGKASVSEEISEAYRELWSDEMALKWRKRIWMYKCIEAGKYLYGVMSWEVLKDLYALRYPHAEMDEIRTIFSTTPENLQWFAERGGRLVLNGFEKNDYYLYLEQQIQKDVPFYIPTKDEVEELYDQGCLISREAHSKLRNFIAENFACSKDIAALKVHELYEGVNNRARVNDAVDAFAAEAGADGTDFSFASDEIQVRFIEHYLEMSRECRVRDNRGHDYYEMVGIMALRNQSQSDSAASGSGTGAGTSTGSAKKPQVKRAKIGRNEPCPCGSGKKYKNCCGRN